jgi:hypothetical protein
VLPSFDPALAVPVFMSIVRMMLRGKREQP